MPKAITIFLHFGYWALYLLLLGVVFVFAGSSLANPLNSGSILPALPLAAICLAPNLFSFYGSYFLIFSNFLISKKPVKLATGIAACALASSAAGIALAFFLIGPDQPIFKDPAEFLAIFFILGAIGAIHSVVALVVKGFVEWSNEVKLRETLASDKLEIESSLVRSQINPHFLFNTLNNIDVLIGLDPRKASEYLVKLSEILRFAVYESADREITLEKEISNISKYLDLQRIRAANPDFATLKVSGDASGKSVAPMVFFPFIENAFKHCENHKESGSIRISINIEEKEIGFRCENLIGKENAPKIEPGGLGSKLIRKRLGHLYPGRFSLETIRSEKKYKVWLKLHLGGGALNNEDQMHNNRR